MTKRKQSTELPAAAITAARWWGDQLRHGARLDNGDDSIEGGYTMVVGLLAQDSLRKANDLSEERIGVFEAKLASVIAERLERSGDFGVNVSVDYHPDHLLREAAEAADIRAGMTLFPWKTYMWVRRGAVEVSCGYQAPVVEIPLLHAG